jgi:hypothetical protein
MIIFYRKLIMTDTMKYVFSLALCTFFALICSVHNGFSQGPTYDKMVDFLPPPPNAAAIVKYGNATINKNTGTPNISIPLGQVKGNKLSAEISIGYNSGGIKVDEIASRVGMGWAINAGGVITRTMRGLPDELNTRHTPYAPIGLNWGTYNYAKRIVTSQATPFSSGGYDSEPDLFNFSFDGFNGSFVLDQDHKVYLVNKSGIKIEKNFNTSAAWNFKITAPDGTVYFFGGASAVEKTKRLQSCGRNYDDFLPTSWYLTEIKHPTGEQIFFHYASLAYEYDNGVTQTMFDPGFSGVGSPCQCPSKATTTCININKTNGVLLSSIVCPGKSSVSIQYTTRPDCDDKIISGITFLDPSNPAVTISSVDFIYQTVTSSGDYSGVSYPKQDKTPYLVSLNENSSDNSLHKIHHFSYNDPEGRPSRLSFSQDHWGNFNGQLNTSFVPDLGTMYHKGFPTAAANREPDITFAKKGLLEKIVYPTGGITRLSMNQMSMSQVQLIRHLIILHAM